MMLSAISFKCNLTLLLCDKKFFTIKLKKTFYVKNEIPFIIKSSNREKLKNTNI